MNLSPTERWILFNQFTILSKLDPDNDGWEKSAEIVACGYELEYTTISEHIYKDPYTLSSEDCMEVLDILDMYDTMQRVVTGLGSSSPVQLDRVHFLGFDGNNETSQMAYARFSVEEMGRFVDMSRTSDLNSHMPSLQKYRRMLAEWKRLSNPHSLDADNIELILSA